jgi:hypothetical protein
MAFEYFGNIHMHTVYSDGTGTFADLVAAAKRAGLDFVYVTDHNVLVRTQEEGYRQGVLTLVGQEVHDENRKPERSHLLCLGMEQDVTAHAPDPQALIDAVVAQGGLAFLAHPIEEYTRIFPDHYDWEDWHVKGYTGVELWNYMARFRGYATDWIRAILMAFFPHWFTEGPLPAMLAKWDVLCQERPVVAIGGTDVHATVYNLGPVRRRFLSYAHCAQALNTHILTTQPLQGHLPDSRAGWQEESVRHDRSLVLGALAAGHAWIGYDLAAPTRGFRFAAWHVPEDARARPSGQPKAIMGDSMPLPPPPEELYFDVQVPEPGDIRLLRDGVVVAREKGTQLHFRGREAGVYRVEVWKTRWGRPRGWIFSNPIYVR